jgi:hypothetical protein
MAAEELDNHEVHCVIQNDYFKVKSPRQIQPSFDLSKLKKMPDPSTNTSNRRPPQPLSYPAKYLPVSSSRPFEPSISSRPPQLTEEEEYDQQVEWCMEWARKSAGRPWEAVEITPSFRSSDDEQLQEGSIEQQFHPDEDLEALSEAVNSDAASLPDHQVQDGAAAVAASGDGSSVRSGTDTQDSGCRAGEWRLPLDPIRKTRDDESEEEGIEETLQDVLDEIKLLCRTSEIYALRARRSGEKSLDAMQKMNEMYGGG